MLKFKTDFYGWKDMEERRWIGSILYIFRITQVYEDKQWILSDDLQWFGVREEGQKKEAIDKKVVTEQLRLHFEENLFKKLSIEKMMKSKKPE